MRTLLLILASAAALAAAEGETLVTAGTAVSETVCALGGDDRIVAVDLTSSWPADLQQRKPVIGYLRALPAEGILATGAGCFLATEDAGPPAVLTQLRDAGMRVELLPVTWTVDGAVERIRAVGRAIDAGDAGDELAAEVAAAIAAVRAPIPAPAEGPRALYVLHPRAGSAMVA